MEKTKAVQLVNDNFVAASVNGHGLKINRADIETHFT